MQTRGLLFPERLPTFERRAPLPGSEELVRWYWISQWDLPTGVVSRQELLPFPAMNLAIENSLVGLAGPSTGTSHRDLSGQGWVVGVLLRPAAGEAFAQAPGEIRDRYVELAEPALHADVAEAMAQGAIGAATRIVTQWLQARTTVTDEGRLANRLVELIEKDPDLNSVEQVAEALNLSTRSLQRLTQRQVGLSPLLLIQRRRLQEAARRLRAEPGVRMADLAAELGYADQSHLVREFRRVLGFTPGHYRRSEAGA